jgi:hypothetical protein
MVLKALYFEQIKFTISMKKKNWINIQSLKVIQFNVNIKPRLKLWQGYFGYIAFLNYK